MSICTSCGSSNIKHESANERILHESSILSVCMESSSCRDCGRQFVSRDQIQRNDTRVKKIKESLTKRKDRLVPA